jgi:hypothetical protein
LKNYIHDPTPVVDWKMIQVEPVSEFPVEMDCILDKRELKLHSRFIRKVKVQWKHFSPKEATWEMEGNMQEAYPFMFQNGIDEN